MDTRDDAADDQPADDLPADLAVWRDRQQAGEPNPISESLRFLAAGEQPRALDTSYLTADDLANPDIAANTRAIEETSALITWAAEDDDEGTAYGYWRGPGARPMTDAPIVSLDNEGQFHLSAGANLSEVLCSEFGQWEDDGYAGLAAACREHGVEVAGEDPIDLPAPAVTPTPAEHHVARYRELLAGHDG